MSQKEVSPEILKEAQRQFDILADGAVDILPENGLMKKLIKSVETQTPLKVKYGMDPTAPDIHLGHCVPLFKLRQFQDLGHTVQLLIGDFTARIGDPSGRNKTRPPLSDADIDHNAKTFAEQAFKVLDKENNIEIMYNGTWLSKLGFNDMIKLLSNVTVSQIMQREDFTNRYENNLPISMHELLYPIMQGYDSVAMECDIEIGGTDQTFNLLMGREMQKVAGLPLQTALTMPIIEGLDGTEKMSKSLGNYIAVKEEPNDMYGKVMSIPDSLMVKYYQYLTNNSSPDLSEPMKAKKELAFNITETFHNAELATAAAENFDTRFSKREVPDELPEFSINPEGKLLVDVLVEIGFAPSKNEARRLIKGGAVKIDGNRIDDTDIAAPTAACTLQAGKRRMGKLIAA